MASREASMSGMASVRATLYNVLMKKTSVYVTACVIGSYAATNFYFNSTDSLWKSINKGVCARIANHSLQLNYVLTIWFSLFFAMRSRGVEILGGSPSTTTS